MKQLVNNIIKLYEAWNKLATNRSNRRVTSYVRNHLFQEFKNAMIFE